MIHNFKDNLYVIWDQELWRIDLDLIHPEKLNIHFQLRRIEIPYADDVYIGNLLYNELEIFNILSGERSYLKKDEDIAGYVIVSNKLIILNPNWELQIYQLPDLLMIYTDKIEDSLSDIVVARCMQIVDKELFFISKPKTESHSSIFRLPLPDQLIKLLYN